MSINRTPADWAAGESPSAQKMRDEIKALWAGLQAPWDTYAPSFSGTVGNGTLTGAYFQMGKTVLWRIAFTAGSSTVFPNNFTFGLPSALPNGPAFLPIGTGLVRDVSANVAKAGYTAIFNGTDGMQLRGWDNNSFPGATAPFTWAAGDVLYASGAYEIS